LFEAQTGLREYTVDNPDDEAAWRLRSLAEECVTNFKAAITCLERAMALSGQRSKKDLKTLARLQEYSKKAPQRPPMGDPTWNHPQLGAFDYDVVGWVQTLQAPAFDAFEYDTGRQRGQYRLIFEADEESELPSADAVALAAKVLANQVQLVPKVTAALWDDINGRGPDSGMWWHNDLAAVCEHLPALARPEDLLGIMGLSDIMVHKLVFRDERPLVELSFEAPFETEHGVGILTDGESVLGTGYSGDVIPFEPEHGARS